MKRIGLISILFGIGITFAFSQDSIISIPDTAFLYALIEEGVDTNGDSLISYIEAEEVYSLVVEHKGIQDLTGIGAFINLEVLECSNNTFTNLDLSNNTALKSLECGRHQLASLDVSNNSLLEELYCDYGQLTSLDFSNNPLLEVLDCSDNQLSNLDVNDCKLLKSLECENNKLTNLDVSNLDSLRLFTCEINQLTNLDVSKSLTLERFICNENQLTSLDVSNNTFLKILSCGSNLLSHLDISNNTAIECSAPFCIALDLSDMPSLHEVCVWTDPFPPDTVIVDTIGSPNAYFTTECLYDSIVYIPDTAFLYALIEDGVDTNGDSLISYGEAEAIIALDVGAPIAWQKGSDQKLISDLTGIEAFVNLDTLNCSGNPLTSLDVSNNIALLELKCSRNDLTVLDVSNNASLTVLHCADNQLTSLDVSNNVALTILDCEFNQLTSLDVSNSTALIELYCPFNDLTSLDVSNNPALTILDCGWNNSIGLNVLNNTALKEIYCQDIGITSLNVSNNLELVILVCENNPLTYLDISNNIALEKFDCSGTQLQNLDISNNTALTIFICDNTPTLYEVCVWTMPFPPEGVEVGDHACPNLYYTTACTIGIEEQQCFNISIYPNPTNILLTIEADILDMYHIEIDALNGQQILIGEMKGTTHQIDLSTFQKGVYFITIRSEDFVTTKKIVKL